MTVIGPGPADVPASGGPGFGTDTAAQIERFHDPNTRALLANTGLTTTALERLLGVELSVRVLRQDESTTAGLPPYITGALELCDTDRALIRHSRLLTPDLDVVSINYVVAAAEPAQTNGIGDLRTPIGHGLIARGMSQYRRVLWAGVRTWPDGRECAAKAYVMVLDERPACYIRESFDPDMVPSARGLIASTV